MEEEIKIAVVLVTYNRLECLKIALDKYLKQTILPDNIIIVNNSSSDGTKEYLDDWYLMNKKTTNIEVITSPKNLGGAGGFSLGIKSSKKLDVDYVFLADDDAYAEPNMIQELKKYAWILKDRKIAALCTSITNNGNLELMHRCSLKRGFFNVSIKGISEYEYSKPYFKLDLLTFVGACVKKSVIDEIGLPNSQYFIYYDDTEYSLRIRDHGDIYCITNSVMQHNVGTDRRNSWKDYYDTRNYIDMVKNNFNRKNFYFSILKMYIKRCSIAAKVFRNRDRYHRKMCQKAILDAFRGQLGISEIYGPSKKNN